MSAAVLKQTPLHGLHVELGAKMVEFAGYSMPVNYPDGIIAEHKHCRASAALFDVSHMGQLKLLGEGAALALETLVQPRSSSPQPSPIAARMRSPGMVLWRACSAIRRSFRSPRRQQILWAPRSARG